MEIRVVPAEGQGQAFTDANFWRVIALLDWSKEEENNEAVLEPAIAFLSSQEEAAIYRFHDILAEKLFALDKRIYADQLGEDAPGEGYFSPDFFLYARACMVANGKTYYESILNDPLSMPEGYAFEPLLSLAEKAYERKTGKPFDYYPAISYETFSNAEGWEDSLLDRLHGYRENARSRCLNHPIAIPDGTCAPTTSMKSETEKTMTCTSTASPKISFEPTVPLHGPAARFLSTTLL